MGFGDPKFETTSIFEGYLQMPVCDREREREGERESEGEREREKNEFCRGFLKWEFPQQKISILKCSNVGCFLGNSHFGSPHICMCV